MRRLHSRMGQTGDPSRNIGARYAAITMMRAMEVLARPTLPTRRVYWSGSTFDHAFAIFPRGTS